MKKVILFSLDYCKRVFNLKNFHWHSIVKKTVIGAIAVLPILLVSCASTTSAEGGLHLTSYAKIPLMDRIYKPNDKKLESIAKVNKPYYQALRTPTYVKVYHGSYKDSQGNVINGGFMWLKVSNGTPKTNF